MKLDGDMCQDCGGPLSHDMVLSVHATGIVTCGYCSGYMTHKGALKNLPEHRARYLHELGPVGWQDEFPGITELEIERVIEVLNNILR